MRSSLVSFLAALAFTIARRSHAGRHHRWAKPLRRLGARESQWHGHALLHHRPALRRALPHRHRDGRHDLAWENDKVTFRICGPALRSAPEDSGIDLWFRRVPNSIIDKWYRQDLTQKTSYHQDHGEGYDAYKVGDTRGCGGLGLWIAGKLVTSDTYVSATILWMKPDVAESKTVYAYPVKLDPARVLRMTRLPATDAAKKAEHAAVFTRVAADGRVSYRAGFAWAGDGDLTNSTAWFHYLQTEATIDHESTPCYPISLPPARPRAASRVRLLAPRTDRPHAVGYIDRRDQSENPGHHDDRARHQGGSAPTHAVQRIDNSSGPNAILFGLGSAGGVVNITTKRGLLSRDTYGADFMIDRYNGRCATIDVNKVLIPKTVALRINAIHERTKKNRANFQNNTDGLQLATTWRASDKTEVRVEFEIEHTTGSVAYPGPHLISAYLTNWLDRGSPVITLPTNWESLATAARNTIANPTGSPTAFIYYTSASPIVVQSGGRAFVFNAVSSLFTNPAQGSNGATSYQSTDPRFFTPRGNINGSGGRKGVNRQMLDFAVDHKFSDKVYLNLSGSHESNNADTFQAYANGAASGAVILGDANGTLTNGSQAQVLSGPALATNASGQLINPFAGQDYTQSRWLHRTQANTRKIIQGTLASEFDLGRWFGHHRMVATTAYMESSAASDNFSDSWLYAPFNASPTNTNNNVFRRAYASPLDADNFHVPDWRDLPVVTWNSPTLGKLTSGWVSQGPGYRTERQISYLLATQSRFFNNHLVLTAGYRVDQATDYVFGQATVKPQGWEASSGLIVLDPTNVTETTTKGPTQTLGAVYNVTKWRRRFLVTLAQPHALTLRPSHL